MYYEQKGGLSGGPLLNFGDFEESKNKPKRGQEEARKKPEEARKRSGRGKGQRIKNIRKKAPKRQEARIWRKTTRNAIFYEQKMTSLGAPEFWRFWRIQEKAKKRPEEARERPEEARRGPEEARRDQEEAGPEWARRGQEEARRGPKRPGIQNLAKNNSENDVSGGP